MKKITKIFLGTVAVLMAISMAPTLYKTAKKQYSDIKEPKTKVGVICIKGQIDEIGKYTKYLKEYFENKTIKAILLNIDSPGGYAGSSEALFNEIIELKKEYPKPIIAYCQNMCASGAYLTACATDYIISTPSALIGSIGAYIGYFKFNDFLQQWKVDYKVHKAGDYKTILSPFAPSTEEQDTLLTALSENTYMTFAQNVATARKLSMNNLTTWGNGKVFTGIQAQKLGLIDGIGSEYNALKKIKELALIDGAIEFVKPKKPSFIEQLTGNDDDCTSASTSILERALMNVLKEQLITRL